LPGIKNKFYFCTKARHHALFEKRYKKKRSDIFYCSGHHICHLVSTQGNIKTQSYHLSLSAEADMNAKIHYSNPGPYQFVWNAINKPAGIYRCRISTAENESGTISLSKTEQIPVHPCHAS
jgi:hypothetical protein